MNLLPNCVAHYKMNDCARNTVVLDSRGFSNGAARRNTQFLSVDGKVGGALTFNGTTDYIDTNNTFQSVFRGNFSINIWCKPDDGRPYPTQYVFYSFSPAGNVILLRILETGAVYFSYYSAGYGDNLQSAVVFANGQEQDHMITVVMRDGTAFIYFDGVLKMGKELCTSAQMAGYTTANPILLGKRDDDPPYPFAGSLDNMTIFDRDLTDDEILYLHNDGAGTEDLGVSAGFMSIASGAAGNLLANSATFQQSVGAEDVEGALSFIYIGAYEPDDPEDPEAGYIRPFALIRNPGSGGIRNNIDSGEFKITFEKEIPAAYRNNDNQQNAQLEFEAWVGQIIAECMAISQSAGYQIVRSFEITYGPYRYPTDPLKDTMGCECTYMWGLGG